MRTLTPLAPPAPPSPPPPRGAQPPAPEASAAPFAAVLDNHQARTAVAEGQTPKRPNGAEDKTKGGSAAGADTPESGAPATPDAQPDAATPAPVLPVLVDQLPLTVAAAA